MRIKGKNDDFFIYFVRKKRAHVVNTKILDNLSIPLSLCTKFRYVTLFQTRRERDTCKTFVSVTVLYMHNRRPLCS